MEYREGDWLLWTRVVGGVVEKETVQVVAVKPRGGAKLSNGWTVDEDGIAEGTGRIPGGRVSPIAELESAAKKER